MAAGVIPASRASCRMEVPWKPWRWKRNSPASRIDWAVCKTAVSPEPSEPAILSIERTTVHHDHTPPDQRESTILGKRNRPGVHPGACEIKDLFVRWTTLSRHQSGRPASAGP